MNSSTIVAEVTQIIYRLFEETEASGHEATLHDIEGATIAAVRRIGELLFQAQVCQMGNGYAGSRLTCKCGGSFRFIDNRDRAVTTMCGQVIVKRAYYYCKRCGASWAPLDDQLGIPRGHFTDRLVEAVSYCCAHLPFESASELVERLTGISISAKEAQLLSEDIGAEIGAELKEQAEVAVTDGLEPECSPSRLYVTVDGVMIREDDGWHETKVAAIYDGVTRVGPDGASEDVAGKITYVARRGAPDEFGTYVSAEAQTRGESKAAEVVAIADGATWIWRLVESYFPEAVQIIDWYHVSEHIWGFARVLHDGHEDRCKAWADKKLALLSDGRVDELVSELKAMTGLCDEVALERDNLARYLHTNRTRMKYDEYRARGYHIGSGVVESACKNVVQIRQKRPGMRWSAEGAQEVLNLRTAILNGRWDRFWNKRMQRTKSGRCNPGHDLIAA